jgi:hypothetical protein
MFDKYTANSRPDRLQFGAKSGGPPAEFTETSKNSRIAVGEWSACIEACSLRRGFTLLSGNDMVHGSSDEFRCPSCGAGSALWLPDRDPARLDATLKCLSCATLIRLPKSKVVGASSAGPGGSARSF